MTLIDLIVYTLTIIFLLTIIFGLLMTFLIFLKLFIEETSEFIYEIKRIYRKWVNR